MHRGFGGVSDLVIEPGFLYAGTSWSILEVPLDNTKSAKSLFDEHYSTSF